MEWISVKDRLPEIDWDTRYLIYGCPWNSTKKDVYFANFWLCGRKKYWLPMIGTLRYHDSVFDERYKRVTHWMPLPNFPNS